LSWKQHVYNIIPKFNRACYAIRLVKPYIAKEILKTLHFSCFYSIPNYGIIFWGNSVCSRLIFKVQKRTIRIISNLGIGDSCRSAFKELGILTFYSQYLYSLLIFVAKTEVYFKPTLISTRLTKI